MAQVEAADTQEGRDLTAFQKAILFILTEEPRYGLAIKRELEAYYGTEVNHGRLYPNLDELVERGFVEKSELDKRTNQYELTAEGLGAVVDDLGWQLSKFVTEEGRAERVEDLLRQSR